MVLGISFHQRAFSGKASMTGTEVDVLKGRILTVARNYGDRLRRARRLFVEERAAALASDREVEYSVKESISQFFGIKYSEVAFAGSAQVGFSAHKNRAFVKAVSDLDVACVSSSLFQIAWIDVITATRAFTDATRFAGLRGEEIDRFKDGILRRGMIRVEIMPRSDLSIKWRDFEGALSRKYAAYFGSVSVAIYLNEYAFCWKQDSAISSILRGWHD